MLKLNFDVSVTKHFSELGILTVYVLEAVMVVRTAEHNLPKLGSSHSYFTINRDRLAISNHSLKCFWKSPKSAGIQFYNTVPQCLKEINNFNLFRNKLKKLFSCKGSIFI